ncbi:MAG: tetratricopeptide repeat protein [Chloroflexota bacterium]|nr:tetratricopeptide repeat protein [Chloroflexota bacterium]
MEKWLNEAHGDYKSGRYEKAAKRFRAIVEADPDNASGHQGLARSLAALGRYQEAIAECRQALELDPESAIPYLVLGYVYLQQRKYQRAESELRRAIELDPRLGRAYTYLGTLHLEQGWSAEAIKSLERAIVLNPDDEVSHINLGAAYSQQGHHMEAYRAYRKAFECNYSFRAGWGMVAALLAKHSLLAGLLFLFSLFLSFITLPTPVTLLLFIIPVGFALLSAIVLLRRRERSLRTRGMALLLWVGIMVAAYVYHILYGI